MLISAALAVLVMAVSFSMFADTHVSPSPADATAAAGARSEPVVDILTPANGATVHDNVKVIARVAQCYCLGNTPSLWVNGTFYENGTLIPTEATDNGYDTYAFFLNGNLYADGPYALMVIGKHNETRDNVSVTLKNTDATGCRSTYLVYPLDGREYTGNVTVVSYVQLCNCTPYCNLYVDGTMKSIMSQGSGYVLVCGSWFYLYSGKMDTAALTNSRHVLVVQAHSDGWNDTISINTNNSCLRPSDDDEAEVDDEDVDDDNEDVDDDNEDADDDTAGSADDDRTDNDAKTDSGQFAYVSIALIASAVLVVAAIAIIVIVIMLRKKRGN